MGKIKKALIIVLIYSIGMGIVMLMTWNSKQYDNNHSQTCSYYTYEIAHK